MDDKKLGIIHLKTGEDIEVHFHSEAVYPLELPKSGLWAVIVDHIVHWIPVDNISYVTISV